MRGYASNFSKSIRAMAAEEEGLLPASRITRPWLNDAGVTEPLTFIKWLLRTEQIPAEEWNHTGARFRRTWYYSGQHLTQMAANGELDRARRFWALPAAERPRTADDWRLLRGRAIFGDPHPLWFGEERQ